MSNERLEGLGPTSVWDRKIQGAGHKNQPVIKKKLLFAALLTLHILTH